MSDLEVTQSVIQNNTDEGASLIIRINVYIIIF